MKKSLEVLFAPAEFLALQQRDLSGSVCVVFDILRATSTMVTALANGAKAIRPVCEISEALSIRNRDPEVLLAGEREGLRIRAHSSGRVEFDLGNSPREFTPERIQGKTIAMTTTNGTRALRACAQAEAVLVGSFLNMGVLGEWIEERAPQSLFLVCAGTIEQSSLEDALAAGALCDLIWPVYAEGRIADSAQMARQIYLALQRDLPGAMKQARNGRRLLNIPELADDVGVCLQRDICDFVAALHKDGTVRKMDEHEPDGKSFEPLS